MRKCAATCKIIGNDVTIVASKNKNFFNYLYPRLYRKYILTFCNVCYRYYTDIIYFLQCQYAGSTSISSLDKVIGLAAKLKMDQQRVDSEMQKVKKCHEDTKYQQQLLSTRLEIVERLKDMLEQQIGTGSVQNVMEHFAETSQQTLSVRLCIIKYKKSYSNNKICKMHIKSAIVVGYIVTWVCKLNLSINYIFYSNLHNTNIFFYICQLGF